MIKDFTDLRGGGEEKKKGNVFLEWDGKRWLEHEERKNETDIYMNLELKKRLDFAKKQKDKNNDCLMIVVGDEGSGKSSFAGNIMEYMSDCTFNPMKDMIGSDYEDGLKKIAEVPEGGNLMFDEGNVFFLSTEVMKKESRGLHKVFSIFRQKRLFTIIVMPSFFRAGSYFAHDRVKMLVRTELLKGQRGYYKYWGEKKAKELYRKGKKDHNYNIVKASLKGKFRKCLKLETTEYKDFKIKTLTKALKESSGVKKKREKKDQDQKPK